MRTIIGDTAKSAKNIAKQVAKQIAQEPLEVLKQVGRQVTSTETGELPQTGGQTRPTQEIPAGEVEKIKVQGQRQLAALEQELQDILVQEKQKKLAKVQEDRRAGEISKEEEKPLVEPSTKRSRRLFGFGPKAQAERQKTHVEKPLPPSG